MDIPSLEIVIPIYNEEECFNQLLTRLIEVRESLITEAHCSFIFVNDGSKDKTGILLYEASLKFPFVKVINFLSNFGHQMAITAGMDASAADYVAVIDADLQDPPELIKDMLQIAVNNQIDVVYGKRIKREGESYFKLTCAKCFYRILNLLCKVEIPADTGDFRLVSKKVIDTLRLLPERHRYVRGLIPFLGFSSYAFEYERKARFAGSIKYTFKKSLALAMISVVSFSSFPLRLASYVGFGTIALSAVYGIYILINKYVLHIAPPGIASLSLMVAVLGGVQLMVLGILGEYLAKMFEELKGRPLYLVRDSYNISFPEAFQFPHSRTTSNIKI